MPLTPPQFLRLVSRLRTVEQPLVLVHGWPASGRSAWLAALADSVPVRYTDQRQKGPVSPARLKEILSDAGRSSGCWFVIDGELGLASLGLASEWLSEDQRLIFSHAVDVLPSWLPLAEIPAQELLLSASEVEELWIHLRDHPPATGQIEQLLAATDGWYEPTRWLLEQKVPLAESLHSHGFLTFLEQHIWEHLPVDRRDLLLEVGQSEDLDEELWRRVWQGDSTREETLQEFQAEWGLPCPSSDRLRFPTLLRTLLNARRQSLQTDEERRELYLRLGEAALELERRVEAANAFALAGAETRLFELLDLHRSELILNAPLETLERILGSIESEAPSLPWWRGMIAAARGAKPELVEASLARAPEAEPGSAAHLLGALALRSVGLAWSQSEPAGTTLFGALTERLTEKRGGRRTQPREVKTTNRTYRLDFLGQARLSLREGNAPALELSSPLRKVFQVIAFLALQPDRRAPKQDLVEAVWPDSDRETIRKNFHPTLSAARRALQGGGKGEAILYQQGLYGLHPIYEWRVDVDLFARRLEEGRQLLDQAGEHRSQALAIWLDAWRLYRGPFLDEHDTPWIQEKRERFQRRYLALLREIGQLAAGLERDEQALDAFRSVLFEDPYDEKVHVSLMRLYARQGRRDLVRRQYVRLQELLDELTVEPLSETQDLYHQLMR